LRQRTNKKAGATVLQLTVAEASEVPPIPNPDGRTWHELTLKGWENAWNSPMAAQWLVTDTDALGRLALLWDEFYKAPDVKTLAEIRQQEQRFGLSPLDRSRLQWEIAKSNEAERKVQQQKSRKPGADPRAILMAV
jgi:hypothetical protein